MPKSGPIEYPVAAGKYRVCVVCYGQTYESSPTLKADERFTYAPRIEVPPDPTVTIDIAEVARAGVAVRIDGEEMLVPSSGEIRYTLRPRAAPYEIVVARGEAENKFERTSEVGKPIQPCIAKLPDAPPPPKRPFDNWLQDLEKAKQIAASEQKHVMVLFAASDWCGSCQRLTREVFAEPDFKPQVAKDFVLVCIDSPRGEARAAWRTWPATVGSSSNLA